MEQPQVNIISADDGNRMDCIQRQTFSTKGLQITYHRNKVLISMLKIKIIPHKYPEGINDIKRWVIVKSHSSSNGDGRN